MVLGFYEVDDRSLETNGRITAAAPDVLSPVVAFTRLSVARSRRGRSGLFVVLKYKSGSKDKPQLARFYRRPLCICDKKLGTPRPAAENKFTCCTKA
jgi:hypothetical protein